jgi:hypothetical protein
MSNAYNNLSGKPERKMSLGRPRHRWEDNTETDLTGEYFECVDWTELTQDRNPQRDLVNMVMK